MASEFEQLTEHLTKGPPLSQADFEKFFNELDFVPPSDYLEFIRTSDGAEGFVGRNYLQVWKAEDLAKLNQDYEVDEYASGYFIFATNGGGTAYAFEKRSQIIVSFEFVGMLIADEPFVLGRSFLGFLKRLAQS